MFSGGVGLEYGLLARLSEIVTKTKIKELEVISATGTDDSAIKGLGALKKHGDVKVMEDLKDSLKKKGEAIS